MNKILIIDDDRELCALIKHSVQSEHIEADFCNTGKEGLQKLKEQEYQLVVLDVMMPGIPPALAGAPRESSGWWRFPSSPAYTCRWPRRGAL